MGGDLSGVVGSQCHPCCRLKRPVGSPTRALIAAGSKADCLRVIFAIPREASHQIILPNVESLRAG